MRKLHWIVIMSLVLVLCVPVAALAVEKCWQTAAGSKIHLYLTSVGTDIWEANGYVVGSPDRPVSGTVLRRGSSVLVNVMLIQAAASTYSVVWDFDLTLPGLNGTGYYRYFGSESEGSMGTITCVPCTFAEDEAVTGDPTEVGIR